MHQNENERCTPLNKKALQINLHFHKKKSNIILFQKTTCSRSPDGGGTFPSTSKFLFAPVEPWEKNICGFTGPVAPSIWIARVWSKKMAILWLRCWRKIKAYGEIGGNFKWAMKNNTRLFRKGTCCGELVELTSYVGIVSYHIPWLLDPVMKQPLCGEIHSAPPPR